MAALLTACREGSYFAGNFTVIAGIDPGKQGAIAFYEPITGEVQSIVDMPDSLSALAMLFQERLHCGLLVVIEDVSAMTYVDASGKTRGQGAAASFNFGKGVGEIHGILAALGIPMKSVKPAVWKALMRLSSDKNESRKLASEKFPKWKDKFARKKDDGRAEAVLLAIFGAERFR